MNQPTQPAQVQEKAPKPQGLLPKNVQSWLLIGLAFLMVAIMWLTGGKKPPTPAKAAPPATPVEAPLEVNESKIADMQNRIQDLQRQQLVAQAALAQQTRQIGDAAHDSPQLQQPSAGGTGEQRPEEDPIQAERKRRAYVSLFASNVALSYRKPPASAPAPATETPLAVPAPPPSGPDTPQIAQLLKDMQTNSIPPVVSPATIPRKQPRTERRNRETLPPCRPSPPMRRQERPTYSSKEPSSKPSSSTVSTGASPVPSSACSRPMSIRTTANTC